jgi:hypothetical protein
MKFFAIILLTFLLVAFSFFPAAAPAQGQSREISVFIDGLAVNFDVQPVIQQGRVLVPFRAVAEALNIKVSWDSTTQTVEASGGGALV